MIVTMKRHATRADSSVPQFKRRVPLDVARRVKVRVVTFALPAVSEGDPLSTRQAAARADVSHHLVQIVRRERAMER